MLISKSDYYFSLFIRNRDNWTCKRCGAYDPPRPEAAYKSHMQNSHFFGRTMEPVRFDEQNCDTLCHGCHRYWEKEDRVGYQAFKVKQLGQQGFDRLVFRAYKGPRVDRFYIALFYYKKLKAMGVAVPANARLDKIATRML